MQYRTGAMAEKQLHRLQRVRFPAAAFTSGDVGFISDNTGVRLAGRAIENARRLYGSGGFQCPHLGDALAPRMGGSSPPRSRSAWRSWWPLRCMVRVWQGLLLKKLLCHYNKRLESKNNYGRS